MKKRSIVFPTVVVLFCLYREHYFVCLCVCVCQCVWVFLLVVCAINKLLNMEKKK